MNYTIEEKAPFRLIGFERSFPYETAYQEIPVFWDEIFSTRSPRFVLERLPKPNWNKLCAATGSANSAFRLTTCPIQDVSAT